jgi:hypothetical protein
MCVYSVEAKDTRQSEEGDRLKVHRFPHAFGLTDPRHPGDKAVCMRNGTNVRFDDIPQAIADRFNIGSEASAQFKHGIGGRGGVPDMFGFVNSEGKSVDVPLEQLVGLTLDVVPAQIRLETPPQTMAETPAELPDTDEVPVGARR